MMSEKKTRLLSLTQNSSENSSVFKKSQEGSSNSSKRKIKRKIIRKVIHNVCVCYKALDGTTQSIVHQRLQDFTKDKNIKELAQSFKEEVVKVNYKELSQAPSYEENYQNQNIIQSTFYQTNPILYMYTPYGLQALQY